MCESANPRPPGYANPRCDTSMQLSQCYVHQAPIQVTSLTKLPVCIYVTNHWLHTYFIYWTDNRYIVRLERVTRDFNRKCPSFFFTAISVINNTAIVIYLNRLQFKLQLACSGKKQLRRRSKEQLPVSAV